MNASASLIAMIALSLATGAQAQRASSCITETEVASLIVYAVPSAVAGITTACTPHLSGTGFLATQGQAFAARYGALQAARWGEAKAGFMKFGMSGKAGGDRMDVLATLPDGAMRPMVDGLITAQIAESVAPSDCAKVERGIELLSGIDPAQAGALVAFTMALTKPKNPQICPAPSSRPRVP